MSFNAENPDESKPIDLFAVADDNEDRPVFGNEAFPFPITEYEPSLNPPEPKPGETETNIVPAMDIAELSEDRREADDITSDPMSPADESGTHITFELGDVLVDEMLDLNDVKTRIETLGGVCRNDVIQLESRHPGLLTDRVSINNFSLIPTPVNLGISLEGIGERIKAILTKIGEFIAKCYRWIYTKITGKEKAAETLSERKAQSWESVVKRAKDTDSKIAKDKKLSDLTKDPLAKKAATVEQYAQLVFMDELTKHEKITKGYNTIEGQTLPQGLSPLFESLAMQFTALSKYEKNATAFVNEVLCKSGPPIKSGTAGLKITPEDKYRLIDVSQLEAERDRVQASMLEKSKPKYTKPDDVLKLKDPYDQIREKLKPIRQTLKGLEDSAKNLADTDLKPEDAKAYMSTVKAMMVEFSVVDLYLDQWVKFQSVIVDVIARVLTAIDRVAIK